MLIVHVILFQLLRNGVKLLQNIETWYVNRWQCAFYALQLFFILFEHCYCYGNENSQHFVKTWIPRFNLA